MLSSDAPKSVQSLQMFLPCLPLTARLMHAIRNALSRCLRRSKRHLSSKGSSIHWNVLQSQLLTFNSVCHRIDLILTRNLSLTTQLCFLELHHLVLQSTHIQNCGVTLIHQVPGPHMRTAIFLNCTLLHYFSARRSRILLSP